MAKVKYRNDPVTLDLLSHLTARGDSQAIIAQEALDCEVAWQKIDPAWCPTANNTLAAFQALRVLDSRFPPSISNFESRIIMHRRRRYDSHVHPDDPRTDSTSRADSPAETKATQSA